ncbi:putative Anthocyanin 5-aromatic acyltransferase [Melia azedarach]|uniref:Anthocyanin 5-aromatic acyltransferase n=1 Tax=Melia azedarach TaxID=155640 RepID=A0ACC1Z4J8_MELAZ|nr:putative Anthocyanin 5-aromatic acyltransferase [Melia azedarach]
MAQPYIEAVKILEQSQVAPPSGSVSTTTIPLTFFDMLWIFSIPMQRIFFYEFPYSTDHFTQNIFPHLKQSLSLTLRRFFPFAANLTCPPQLNKPYILYKEGDSILVTVAQSGANFNHLIANTARDNLLFQSFVPKLPTAIFSTDKTNVVPIMAMQFTVFPNSGISIGVAFTHVSSDGRSFNHFMKSWASIYRSGEEDLTALSLPCHNKDLIKDPDELSSIFFNDWWNFQKNSISNGRNPAPQDNVRVTLELSHAQIEKLKERVTTQNSENNEPRQILRISTYAVTCAFMWVNLMKLQECETSGHLNDDIVYHFVSVADCRERVSEFPIPAAYFGNCLAFFFASAKRSELMGENGIVVAAKAIGRAIHKLEKGPLIGAENWVSDLIEIFKVPGRIVSVAGSPRLRVYDTDFGWDRPRKSEVAHIGAYGAFSINECRDGEGEVEIGLVLSRDNLEYFNDLN